MIKLSEMSIARRSRQSLFSFRLHSTDNAKQKSCLSSIPIASIVYYRNFFRKDVEFGKINFSWSTEKCVTSNCSFDLNCSLS